MTVSQMTIFRCVTIEAEHAESGKDSYYGIKNNSLTNWRAIVMAMFFRFEVLKQRSETTVKEGIRCFIADDTAMQKRGKTIEGISRIWDHVFHRSILGFKGLFLAYWDSVNLIPIDFSLHNEKGKNTKKPFGFTPKALKARYHKDRPKTSPGSQRIKELEISKITSLINMIERALKLGIKAEYLLVDSWFMCEELIRTIFDKPGMFILGMFKFGKAKYDLNEKQYSAKQLLQRCKRTMKVKRSRKIKAHYYVVNVGYKGMQVRLFLSRYPNQTSWNLLLTDNMYLSFDEAIKIYQIRWGIEVFF
ncbi:MAG: transposase [Bacteroidales bacterium]|nr:transposase [Bacteroidales bacterium]